MIGRVAIVGLGLIGGSLGMALREKRTDKRGNAGPFVIGWDCDEQARVLAQELGAIDRAVADCEQVVIDADLVVVAVPVLAVREIFGLIGPALQPGTVVTDVASTKASVCAWAAEFLPEGIFIGGHPMAGSEQSGVGNARAALFAGATYCLTPTAATSAQAIERAIELVHAVGARPHVLDPDAHDRAVAAVSHLPFLLSTALVNVTSQHPEWPSMRALAASGYRDVSRLASGDVRMHHDICLSNADAIRPWLLETAAMLQSLASDLDDPEALTRHFERAKLGRDAHVREQEGRAVDE